MNKKDIDPGNMRACVMKAEHVDVIAGNVSIYFGARPAEYCREKFGSAIKESWRDTYLVAETRTTISQVEQGVGR